MRRYRRNSMMLGKQSFPSSASPGLPVSLLRTRYVLNLMEVSPFNEVMVEMILNSVDEETFMRCGARLFQRRKSEPPPDLVEEQMDFWPQALAERLHQFAGTTMEKNFRVRLGRVLAETLDGKELPETYLARKRTVGEMLGIDQVDLDILECVAMYRSDKLFEAYCDQFVRNDWPALIASAIGHPFAEVHQRITGPRGLIGRQFIRFEACSMDIVAMLGHYLCGLREELISPDILSSLPESPYPLESFPIKPGQRRILLELLRNPKPCHILFHGRPGTGKTELARALGKAIGRMPLLVRYGDNGTPSERRGAISGAFCLASTHALLIVDEADGLLNTLDQIGRDNVDKGWINNFIDECRHKVIWIANNIRGIDDSVLRRFSFSVEFQKFTEEQRRRVWERHLHDHPLGDSIPPDLVRDLSKNYEVDAGAITSAFQALHSITEGIPRPSDELHELLDTMLRHHENLSGVTLRRRNLNPLSHAYAPEALHTDIPTGEILRALAVREKQVGGDKPALPANLLFWGLPGTGKTEFAKHLARSLDKPLQIHRMSDLQSMYLGETEKKIAKAFREAEVAKAILFLDEADSLIVDRSLATRSWEASQTNEFLTQIENFHGVCICCTNLLDRLDEAVLRRFTWKIKFLPLTPDGRELLFRRHFLPEGRLSPGLLRGLHAIPNLTPGDFKTVWQRHQYLEVPPGPADIVQELAREAAYKRDPASKPIGF